MDSKLLNEIIEDFGLSSGEYYLSQLFQRNFLATKKIVLTFKSKNNPSLLLRIPNDLKKEFKVFTEMNRVGDLNKKIRASIPFTKYYEKPFSVFVQKWIEGEKVFLSKNNSEIASWSSSLHKCTTVRNSLLLENHLLDIIKRISKFLSAKEINKLKTKKLLAMKILDKEICFCHGDFTPANVLNSGKQIFVIDWEDYELFGYYLYDLLHFRFFEERMKVSSLKKIKLSLFISKVLDSQSKLYVKYYKNISSEQLETYFPFYLANRLLKYQEALKSGVWKQKYYDFYLKTLKYYLGLQM